MKCGPYYNVMKCGPKYKQITLFLEMQVTKKYLPQ